MPIFVSYARKDRDRAETLVRDLESSRNLVWMDSELTGGQAWWDAILEQIRQCELYVFVLSPESLRSRACRLELDYAVALGRPLLPVQIRDVAISTAPPPIADTHIVDYRERTADAGIALVAAVAHHPPPPPLPDPMPAPPPPPMSYMNEFRDQLDAPSLSYQQQSHLLVDLRGYLSDDDDGPIARELIATLRGRRDIAESIGREIDQLMGWGSVRPEPAQPVHPGTPIHPGTPAVGRRPENGFGGGHPAQPGPGPNSTYQPIPGGPTPPQVGPYPHTETGPHPGTATPQPHPQATTVLVLGIVGLVLCGAVGIPAGLMGTRVLREIDSQPGRYSGRSRVSVGRTLGWVGLGLWVLGLMIYGFTLSSSSS